MKCVTDVCDGGATVNADPYTLSIVEPEGFERHFDVKFFNPYSLQMEYEATVRRLEGARMFARANRVNRWHGASESKNARLGIVATGKAWLDLLQAMRDLGIVETDLERFGIRLGKIAMPFPLEPEFVRDFSRGLRTLLVVEEKRSFVETQDQGDPFTG